MTKLVIFILSALFLSLITNAAGKVLELDERFAKLDQQGLWLVMFYAPWCGHCKRLEPTWIEVGATFNQQQSEVHVARLDATKYSSMAGYYKVRGFPTIKFFKNGQQIDYNGPRSKESIISFVNRAKGPDVTELDSRDSFLRFKAMHDVFFIYVGEKTPLKDLYFQAAKSVFTSISLFSGSKNILPKDVTVKREAAVLVFKDGKHYEAPNNPPDADMLKMWLLSEQFPSYNHLTGGNYHSLRSSGRRFAISVTEKNDPINQTLNDIALEKKYQYTFCWVEGNSIVNSLTYGTISVPNVVVYDSITNEYFVMNGEESQASSIGKDQIKEFFEGIASGKIASKGGNGFFEHLKRAVSDFVGFFVDLFVKQPLLASLVVLVPTVIVCACCFCLCTMSDDVPTSEEDEDSDFDERMEDDPDGEAGPADDDLPAAQEIGERDAEGLRHRVQSSPGKEE